MTFSDLFKLIRHYLKLVVALPIACMIVMSLVVILTPPTFQARASLLTNGDVALAGGYAQNEAAIYSQNGIKVTSSIDAAYMTISVVAEGDDYGGCIAAANATILAAADDFRNVNEQASISTNEAVSASSMSPNIARTVILAFLVGLFIALCIIVALDFIKTPIKSRSDIEAASGLTVVGSIPNRDKGERLLANIRFLSEDIPETIAIVPTGLSGATLTCAELVSSFERAGVAVSRAQGSPHAQSMNVISKPGTVTIIECASISEGMGAAYIAKEADLTILCATEWVDSRRVLNSVAEELRFAKAKIGGVVFLTSRHVEMF